MGNGADENAFKRKEKGTTTAHGDVFITQTRRCVYNIIRNKRFEYIIIMYAHIVLEKSEAEMSGANGRGRAPQPPQPPPRRCDRAYNILRSSVYFVCVAHGRRTAKTANETEKAYKVFILVFPSPLSYFIIVVIVIIIIIRLNTVHDINIHIVRMYISASAIPSGKQWSARGDTAATLGTATTR